MMMEMMIEMYKARDAMAIMVMRGRNRRRQGRCRSA